MFTDTPPALVCFMVFQADNKYIYCAEVEVLVVSEGCSEP